MSNKVNGILRRTVISVFFAEHARQKKRLRNEFITDT